MYALVADKHGDPATFVATTIVIAQGTMIVTALLAMRLVERGNGYWLVLLISFAALPVRGVIAAYLTGRWGVVPVQMLDGVGAGLQSVLSNTAQVSLTAYSARLQSALALLCSSKA